LKGVLHWRALIQSSAASAQYIDYRIEAFLVSRCAATGRCDGVWLTAAAFFIRVWTSSSTVAV